MCVKVHHMAIFTGENERCVYVCEGPSYGLSSQGRMRGVRMCVKVHRMTIFTGENERCAYVCEGPSYDYLHRGE